MIWIRGFHKPFLLLVISCCSVVSLSISFFSCFNLGRVAGDDGHSTASVSTRTQVTFHREKTYRMDRTQWINSKEKIGCLACRAPTKTLKIWVQERDVCSEGHISVGCGGLSSRCYLCLPACASGHPRKCLFRLSSYYIERPFSSEVSSPWFPKSWEQWHSSHDLRCCGDAHVSFLITLGLWVN